MNKDHNNTIHFIGLIIVSVILTMGIIKSIHSSNPCSAFSDTPEQCSSNVHPEGTLK